MLKPLEVDRYQLVHVYVANNRCFECNLDKTCTNLFKTRVLYQI
jgi:hypothetical protein